VSAAAETAKPVVAALDSDPTARVQESAPDAAVVVDDFDLPLKKKRRRPVRQALHVLATIVLCRLVVRLQAAKCM
jgi:hypothetical protein